MDIAAIEDFFKTAELPKRVDRGGGMVINDVQLFVNSHLTIVKAHGSIPAFRGFALRLEQVYDIVKTMPANANPTAIA